MANETITFEYGGSSCSRFSSSEIYQGRDHYTFPISKQRFSLNLFYNSGSDQTSTDLELHKIEPIFTDTAFQDGRSPSVERYHRERRLYVQGRSQRRICSSTSSQSFTKIFDIREQQYCLPIHLSSLRSEHCTSSFFKIDEICGRAFTGEGYAPCLLSRRYLCIGEIEKQDARISTDTNSTSRESGLPHPQGEECARAEKDPGISRVSIQHSNNVNLSSNPQSNQVTTANQTSRGTSHTIMPMDSESVREDDSRHPSNRGSSVTYPTHATRFIQKLEDTQSQLGQELQTISPIDGGDHMVEKIFSKEKRSTNSQTTNSRTICQDLCRCVRCGLGSDFPVDSNCRILDTSRKRTIDQREGIENDLLRPSHTLKKTKTHHNQDFERQYDSLKICNEGRRNSIVCTSRSGSEDTRFMQPTSLNSTVPTHTGNPQCDSRPTESIQETVIRIDDSQENVPVYLQKMEESNEGRCFRRSSQPPTTELLEFPGGSICDQDRRLPPRLEEERTVHVSTMETDSEGSAENESGQDERGYLGDSIMEESILVPHNFTNETSGSTRSMECEQPMEVNRLEVISHKRKNNGLNQDTIKHLSKTTRSSTSKAYNSYWRKYAVWCRTRNYDPKIYNIQQIVTFLVDNRDKSYSTLNGYRSAVASVLTVLHPNSKPIAESRDIVDFFKAKRRGDVQIKKITQLETWDVDTLIQYIRLNLSPSASLNLQSYCQLPNKTIKWPAQCYNYVRTTK